MISPEALWRDPNALAPDYSLFRVAERLLLTGHSHQAWPDVGLEGQRRAWLDAAERVDGKWEAAFERAERVRAGWRRLLDDPSGHVALGPSTHDLLVRFLSALPLRARPRLVTTDGEFHTIRRQLDRLAEEGLEVVKVPAEPVAGTAERLGEAVDDRTAAVLVSSVLFRDARIVPGIPHVAGVARRHGARLLVDAYHHLNAIPFSVPALDLEDAFVVGGGYKYCQLGEGNCFLRFPGECRLRPVVTGWFAEFFALTDDREQGEEGGEGRAARRSAGRRGPDTPGSASARVRYGRGVDRFAGATYDPTSHYRASVVFDFFEERGLTPELLRAVGRHQVELLARSVDALDADPAVLDRDRGVHLEDVGGFLALRAPRAEEIQAALLQRGVRTDVRGTTLRLGPAPYLSDRQLTDAVGILGEVVRGLPDREPRESARAP